MDQHDKWKKFGLRLHLGIEPFVGKLLWIKIWWNNGNPKYVCKQYCDAVRKYGKVSPPSYFIYILISATTGLPLVTQSDPGTENYNVAYAQTTLRHELDNSLAGSIQHKWYRGHGNIKPEQAWWRVRETWSAGFEGLLDKGVRKQWYNADNVTDK